MARKVYTDLSDTIQGWRVKTNLTAEYLGDLDSLNSELNSTTMVAAVNSTLARIKGFDSGQTTKFVDSDYVRLRADSNYVRSAADSGWIRSMFSVDDQGGDGSLAYDEETGVVTYIGPSATEVRAHFTAGTGITITSGQISADQANINITNLDGYNANALIDHTNVNLTAGAGLTGGGNIAANRSFAVGAGTGVTVNANDVAIGQDVATTSNVTFGSVKIGTYWTIEASGQDLIFRHGTSRRFKMDANGNFTAVDDIIAVGTV